MKLEVDSKEFSTACGIVSRFGETRSSSDVPKSILIITEDGEIVLYATDLATSIRYVVNGLIEEEGEAIVNLNHLQAATYDSGGSLTIRTTKAKLMLEYENEKVRLDLSYMTSADDWPVWLNMSDGGFSIPFDLLRTAALHAAPPGESGRPILNSVHLIPHEDGIVVSSSNGVFGFRGLTTGELSHELAIDGKILQQVGNLFSGGILDVVVGSSLVGVSAYGNPAQIQLLRSETESFKGIAALLTPPDNVEFTCILGAGSFAHLLRSTKIAHGIDPRSEIGISADDDGTLIFQARGPTVDMPETKIVCEGNLKRWTTLTKYAVRLFNAIRISEDAKFGVDEIGLWIQSGNDYHRSTKSTGTWFDKDLMEPNGGDAV
jgi:hypothetical protein